MSWGMKARRFVIMAAYCVWIGVAVPVGAQEQATGTIHVVQRGETLIQIAQRYGASVQRILQFNGIRQPRLVRAGITLRIPMA